MFFRSRKRYFFTTPAGISRPYKFRLLFYGSKLTSSARFQADVVACESEMANAIF
jgi:hypothetical protein